MATRKRLSAPRRFPRSGKAPPTYTLGLNRNIQLWDYSDADPHPRGQKPPPQFIETVSASLVQVSSAGGVINVALDADPIAGFVVNAWATRYATLFREYRILKVFFRIKALSANIGQTEVTIDEVNGTVPTLALMEDQGYVSVNNAVGSNDTCYAQWRVNDLAEAAWKLTTASMTPCYLKIYTDNATLNTPAAATTKFDVRATYTIAFRGRV